MFENLPNVTRIGIKMSGGADSSLLAYLLAKYIAHSKLDIELFPIIIIEKSAPFQEQFTKSVIKFTEQEIDFKFKKSFVYAHKIGGDKIQLMREIEATLFDSNLLDCIISGTTQEPRQGFNAEGKKGPADLRVGNFQQIWGNIYTPFINIDKKDLALIYKEHNLLSTLFPITRSCVKETMNFDTHCGKCWWCNERSWAFGKL
jgi:hypothetical protein